ncbi:MAG: peptidoglycan DD-metalloendopeptidase family protein [Alphaproteobacteria bacterium]|nr:peptidoglycan DD-metalloendopeptidase family protein [Alphaproteobacteria bacterium]
MTAIVAACAAVYGVLSFNKPETDAAAAPRQTAAFVAPRPGLAEQHADETLNGPGTDFPLKPFARPAMSSPLADHLSSIQTGISNMLEASNDLLVSEKKVVVGKGDTLMDLLVKKAFVPREDAYRAVQALSKVYNPRDINPGHEITVFFHKDPSIADPKFKGVRIEKDIINTVTVNRDDDGRYTVNKEEKSVHRTLNGYRGTIDSSLYVDAKAAGVPDGVILDLIKMYSWNVDFQREIHSGDAFEVMYEEYKTEDGKTVRGKGNIVYAKLTLGDNAMPFYRFEDARGDADYYDNGGRSAKKPLMKTPVDGARLSSGFGMRKHPVLGYSKMHKGVDFAAPRGTPIYAAGDGVIARLGPFSSYGNYIRIRHRAGLETAYAHMSKFKAGLHSGSRVKQGQVIGYIGTTGRSTGPHLHYEVMVNNTQVNPASVKLPTGKALKGKELKLFQNIVAETQGEFEDFGHVTAVAQNDRPAHKPEKVAHN